MASTAIMADVNNVTDDYLGTTTDGYLHISVHAYRKGMDQRGTIVDWLHYNTTDANLLFQNTTVDDVTTQDDGLPFTIFMLIVSLFILLCNGLTIIVVVKFIKKVTPTHVVIAFLAFAGLFVGMTPFLNLIFLLTEDSNYTDHVNVWFFWAAGTLNTSAILLIAVERCFLVTSWKLYLKYWTVRRQVGLCMAFCVYSFLFSTIFASMAELKYKYRISDQLLSQKKVVFLIRFILLPFFTLKTCVIVFCYLTICVFLWKNKKTNTSNQNSSGQQMFRKEEKTTVLIVVILTLYMIGTFLPFVYTLLAQKYPKIYRINLFRFLNLIWHVISLLDTFVYAWKVPEFREGYYKLLCCVRGSRSNQVAPAHIAQFHGIYNIPLEPRR